MKNQVFKTQLKSKTELKKLILLNIKDTTTTIKNKKTITIPLLHYQKYDGTIIKIADTTMLAYYV